jgi:GTPase SAR1 family protein
MLNHLTAVGDLNGIAVHGSTLDLEQYRCRKDRVVNALDQLADLARRLHTPAIATELKLTIADLESEVFRLVVVGEFSRGKSTIINALLGERVLPSSVQPTTAVLSMISGGPESTYTLHFHDGPPRTITVEEFTKLVAPGEPGRRNPDSRARYEERLRELRSIALVRIKHPSPFCTAGVEIVDTPGTNDLDPLREQITYEFIPRADAVLFILSAKSILMQSEIDFVTDRILKADIQRIFFLVNFTDLLSVADSLFRAQTRYATAFEIRHGEDCTRITLMFALSCCLIRDDARSKHGHPYSTRSAFGPIV